MAEAEATSHRRERGELIHEARFVVAEGLASRYRGAVNDDANVEEQGAGGPPWLPTIGTWFFAAAVLLLLPRMWIPAALCTLVGAGVRGLARRNRARELGDQESAPECPSSPTE